MNTLSKIAILIIVSGAVLLAVPAFGFTSLVADRGVSVATADNANALLEIEETGETPDNQNDVDVIEITNSAEQDFETLATNVTLDDSDGALAISNDFATSLNDTETTGLELTCEGGGSGTATVTIEAEAIGPTIQIQNANTSYTFDYSCTGGGSGPTADAGGPYEVYEDNEVELDGTESTTSTGNIDSYNWQITSGDGQLTGATTATPTYIAPNNVSETTDMEVELTVSDNSGNSDSDTATITVRTVDNNENNPPIADFSYDYNENSEKADLDASSSSDPDGAISVYEWDIGNNGTIDEKGQEVNGVIVSPGTEVKLIVTDDDGATDSITKIID
ncbi:PKD domain-containing protein [Natronococcus wangiae]|uniref:PKD domain-containing protein n=1 Tax=Natronococcus wangiae TaxID=3068275 RepID=UPI00273D1C36|nr:PKD domain-containing protein [Natronococcus sp. AD5]